eukprot:NODE_419_length_7785_cov_0.861158.p6 type:complete len:142 gc:universal NODE_419_length_7785_cov_0.861158:2365-1940(-)
MALEKRNSHLRHVTQWKDVLKALDDGCIMTLPWCQDSKCELDMKKRTAEHGEAQLQKFKEKMAKRAAKKQKKKGASVEDVSDSLQNIELDENKVDEDDVVMPVSMGMKSLCMPEDQPNEDLKICVGCGQKATIWGLFGRSY